VKVTIIGAGNMGRGIGTRAVAGGHDLQVIDRDPAEAESLAQQLGGGSSSAGTDADLDGEVVVLALYYPGVLDAVREYGDRLAGKVVVEISNPIDFDTMDGLATPTGTSAAEQVAELVPEGARVVKAFNTTFAGTLTQGEAHGQTLDVFVAGDDEEAKRKVIELAQSGGLRAIDAGQLRRARQLEETGFLNVALQEPLGAGFGSALKVHW
jgi:8-hydroxy-5-deazaflavin:NADPH oxidoreductase